MKTNRKKQLVTLSALLVAVIGLTIGFSLFSTSLNIKSGLTVNPNGAFAVLFSSSDNITDFTVSGVPANPIHPKVNDSAIVANNALIDNNGPTIYNLGGTVTGPGQTIEYDFYVVNISNVTAYLKSVIFNNVEGTNSNIKCSTLDGTYSQEVEEACENISIGINLGGEDGYATESLPLLSDMPLPSHMVAPSKVIISYNGSSTPSQPFIVEFGDITITFMNIDGGEGPNNPQEELPSGCDTFAEKSFDTCTYTDLDSSGSLTMGDYIKCGTEGFYAIANPSEGKVNMLAEYNLNIAGLGEEMKSQILAATGEEFDGSYACSTIGYQDEHVRGYADSGLTQYQKEFTIETSGETQTVYLPYGTIAFANENDSEYGYWTNGINDSLNQNFQQCIGDYCYEEYGIQYPIEVYGISNSQNGGTDNLIPYVNSYVGLLNAKVLGASATGRLITYKELLDLGCSGDNEGYSCKSAPSWVYDTSYWSGSADDSSCIWIVFSNGFFSGGKFTGHAITAIFDNGLRPVVNISTSAIQAS